MRILLIVAALTAGAWLAVQERAARAEQELTKIAFEDGDPAGYEQLLETDRRLNPDRRADLFEGVILGQAGDFRGAVAAIQRVTRAEPENIEAWGLLASVAQRVDPALAAEARRRARELSPPVPRPAGSSADTGGDRLCVVIGNRSSLHGTGRHVPQHDRAEDRRGCQ